MLLRKAESFLGNRLAQRTASGAADVSVGDGMAAPGDPAPTAPGRCAPSAAPSTRARTSIKALDAICSYYAKNEPSSPVPMFMERCKKLVMMSFVDIVKELVPDALSKVDMLRGQSEG